MIYSWDHIPNPGNPKAFLILMLVLQTGMAGTFIAQDLILFFVFFELVLLPMYFMIGVWGGEQRQYASLKFFLYTMFGSALMLVAFLALYFQVAGKTPAGEASFSIPYLVENGGLLGKSVQVWIFAGMFIGFAVKVPMFPFHTWLPDAHTQAPTQGSVILAAILLKLGTYGFVRIAIPILPKAAVAWAPYIGGLAVIGIIYGALGCLAQTDMKRLIAFSSVAHMGFVMLGYLHADSAGHQRCGIRHGRARSDHRHVVLRRRFGEGALPHARDQAPWRNAHPDAQDGLDSGFLCDGLAWLARPCRVLGRVPGNRVRVQPLRRQLDTARAEPKCVPRVHGDCGCRHCACRRVSAVAVPTCCLRRAEGRVRRRRPRCSRSLPRRVHAVGADVNEHHSDIHDVSIFEWVAWIPFLVAIVVFGVYPQLMFKVIDPAVAGHAQGLREGLTGARFVPRCGATSPRRRSTITRSRPRSSSPLESAWC